MSWRRAAILPGSEVKPTCRGNCQSVEIDPKWTMLAARTGLGEAGVHTVLSLVSVLRPRALADNHPPRA